jgi:hypothetical protein
VTNSFAWLLAVLIVIGFYRLTLLIATRRGARIMSTVAVCGLAMLSVIGDVEEMGVVFRNKGSLAVLNAPSLRAAYRYLDNHPGSTILIRELNPVVMGWLSYHGRESAVYVDRALLTGNYLPPGEYPFYAAPPDMSKVLIASRRGLEAGSSALASVRIDVRNPQGKDQQGLDVWYWMGDGLDFVIWMPDGGSAKRWILEFVATPGPANPIPSRRLAVTVAETQNMTVEIRGRETLRIPVELKGGTNIVRVRAVSPTEQTVWAPNDSRKLMVRIGDVALRQAQE